MRLHVLLILFLLGPAVYTTASSAESVGIDFYHFWLPSQANALAEESLGSPYAEAERYAEVLNERADRLWSEFGADERAAEGPVRARAAVKQRLALLPAEEAARLESERDFLVVNARRRSVDLTAPPLLYALCAFLPGDYGAAGRVWAWVQFLGFVLGAALLWRAAGGPFLQGLLFGMVLMVLFMPYRTDVSVGNSNCVQLLLGALVLGAAVAVVRNPGARVAGVAVGLALFYVMLKPNFALLGGGVIASVAYRLPRQEWGRAAAIAAVPALLLWLWPCLYFGSFGVWFDWLGYITSDAGKLAYAIKADNLSAPLHMAEWFGGDWPPYSWLLGAGLVVTAVGAFSILPGDGLRGRLVSGLRATLADPFAAASAGMCVTLATSPLVWSHYTMVALVTFAWVLRDDRRPGLDFWLIAITVLLYGRSLLPLIDVTGLGAGTASEVRGPAAMAWIPLWLAVLLRIVRSVRAPAVAAGPVATDPVA